MARVSASLPASTASSRRSLVNHCRILVRARDEPTKLSQSCDGPAVGEREVKISTTSPLESLLSRRDQRAVDPGADGAVADLGVHREGEVDRRGLPGQADDVALGREDEDLLRTEVVAQRLEELAGLLGLALPVQQLAQPQHVVGRADLGRRTELAGAGPAAGPRALLVLPVRGDAVVGGAVHVVRADLQLDRLAVRADHRRVQRLVHVELRHRHEVLEAAGQRLPVGVHDAQRRVAVAHRVDQDPDADEVPDVGEVAAADDHLLVDRVVVLGPAGDDGLDLRGLELLADRRGDLGQVGVPRRRALGDQPHDLVVALRVQRREREVLELPLDRVHAQPVGQRGEDLQRLARLLLLLLGREEAQRAHVVQPVGQLDDQHPRVAGHRDDHLADRLGLGRVAQLDLVDLGDAVDEVGDLGAEVGGDRVQGDAGVLDRVVQQRGHQRRGVHAQAGQDRGDGQRVGDVGVAALALLRGVGGLGDVVGPLQQRQVGLGVALPVQGGQRLEHRADDGLRWPATIRRASRSRTRRRGAPSASPGSEPTSSGRRTAGRSGSGGRWRRGRRRRAAAARRAAVGASAAGSPGPRGSRVCGYVRGHGDSCPIRGGMTRSMLAGTACCAAPDASGVSPVRWSRGRARRAAPAAAARRARRARRPPTPP